MFLWFEDPIFDTTEETENGKAVRGDDWRRLMCLREQAAARGAKGEMVAVAGTTFRAGAIERVLRRGGGGQDSVRLVPEPENPHDRAAVRVEINGEHVGYIPRGKALPLQATAQVVKMGAFQAPYVWLFLVYTAH